MEAPVWSRLEDAKEKLEYADGQLSELDSLTSQLLGPMPTSRQRQDVSRVYLGWLVFARQVSVSIHEAWRAAGSPAEFGSWWADLARDPTHAFFRDARNTGLKGAGDIIFMQSILDERTSPLAYWTFAGGPHHGDPLVARCQLYTDWLYYSVWSPAAERLFEWTLPERRTRQLTAPSEGAPHAGFLFSALTRGSVSRTDPEPKEALDG